MPERCDYLAPREQEWWQPFTIRRTDLQAAGASPSSYTAASAGLRLGDLQAQGPGPWYLVVRLELSDTDLQAAPPRLRGDSLASSTAPNIFKLATIYRQAPVLRIGVMVKPGGRCPPYYRYLDVGCADGGRSVPFSAEAATLFAWDWTGGENNAGAAWSTVQCYAAIVPVAAASIPSAGYWRTTDWLRAAAADTLITCPPPPGVERVTILGSCADLVGVFPTMQAAFALSGGGLSVPIGPAVTTGTLPVIGPIGVPTGTKAAGILFGGGGANAPTDQANNFVFMWDSR